MGHILKRYENTLMSSGNSPAGQTEPRKQAQEWREQTLAKHA